MNRSGSLGLQWLWMGLVLAGLTAPLRVLAADEASAAPENAEYIVEDIQGSHVQVLEDGAKGWEKAEEGQVLGKGDEIKVGDGSEVTLMLQSETSVHLTAGADLKVAKIEANQDHGFLSRLSLLTGSLLADVKKHLAESRSSFEVESNGIVCGVRGTAFEVSAQGEDAQVSTHEGLVEVGNGRETQKVEAGNLLAFQKGKFRLKRLMQREELGRFQKWRSFRRLVGMKRAQRLMDIRNHKRKPWKRRRAAVLEKRLHRNLLKKRNFRD